MNHCPTCQAPIPEGARFCPRCGVRTVTPSEMPTATGVPGGPARDRSAAAAHPTTAASVASVTSVPGGGRFLPGQMVAGRYRVIGLLGRGGMGEVYRADDLKLGQPVALKFLPRELERNPERLERFLNEVRTARQIAHPNVCRVYDVGEADDQHFLSMEYVDGEDLATLLRRIGYIPTDKAVQIARQLCAGLAAAHGQGFLHRDLKPANIMLDGNGRVRITDFGLAGLAESFRGAEVRAGTPGYMSPEQLSGDGVSVRSDLYALGLVLYEMCTGRPAFEASNYADMVRLQRESAPPSPTSLVQSVDPVLERVILRCLDSDPERRPNSAIEVAASLPGGDPLAAALAAGETPSPEMVAAAGGIGALTPARAIGLFVVGLATAVALALVPGRFSMIARLDPAMPPEAMRARAAEIARDLGWNGPVRDRVSRFATSADWVLDRQKNDPAPDRWDDVETVRPAPLAFWQRQSPEPLVPSNFSAQAGPSDPPETVAGMTRVVLDPEGRLVEFLGVTDERQPGIDPGGEPDWTVAFEAAGLSWDDAEPIEPAMLPRTGAAVRQAWRAAWTDRPDERVRVEAAAFAGRTTYFDVVPAWEEENLDGAAPQSTTPGGLAAQIISLVLFAILVAGGMFLARRNVRMGRGDRRGAFRLALAVGAISFLGWALAADHVASFGEVGMMFDALAYATMVGSVAFMVYLAIEPYVRRIWPDALIAWSRLLDGRVRDPLVGRDVLIGATAGIVVAGLIEFVNWAAVWTGSAIPPPSYVGVAWLTGIRLGLGVHVGIVFSGIVGAVGILFLAVLLSMVFRNRWVAAGVVWLAFTTTQAIGLLQVQPAPTAIALAAVLWGAMMFVLLRRGVLAVAVLLAVANSMLYSGRAIDLSRWWGTTEAIVPVAIVALLAWGAWTSLAARSLFHDPLAPPPRTPTATPR